MTSYEPVHPDGVKAQSRFKVLHIFGKQHEQWNRDPLLDWEVKGASTPYDNVQELAVDYQLGPLRDVANVEDIGFNVAALDYAKSSVSGTKAKVILHLASGLSPEKVTLCYRVFRLGRVTARSSLHGDAMQWTQAEVQVGNAQIEVPEASVLHCLVGYAGTIQHHGWVYDPATVQNARRAANESFDAKLEILNDIIFKVRTHVT